MHPPPLPDLLQEDCKPNSFSANILKKWLSRSLRQATPGRTPTLTTHTPLVKGVKVQRRPVRPSTPKSFALLLPNRSPLLGPQLGLGGAKTVKISLFLHLFLHHVFGFLHLKTKFLHPKIVNISPFPGEHFTILGAKIWFSGAKTPCFRCNFFMFWVQK